MQPYKVFKIVLIGDCRAGKSSIFQRWTKKDFTKNYISTIGLDMGTVEICTKEFPKLIIQIWDCTGQERLIPIIKNCFPRTDLFILVYDVTDDSSFTNIKDRWLECCNSFGSPSTNKMIIGNKSDLIEEEPIVDLYKVKWFAKKKDIYYGGHVSALDGDGVYDILLQGIDYVLLKKTFSRINERSDIR